MDFGQVQQIEDHLWIGWEENLISKKWRIGTTSQEQTLRVMVEVDYSSSLTIILFLYCVQYFQIIIGKLTNLQRNQRETGLILIIREILWNQFEKRMILVQWRIG